MDPWTDEQAGQARGLLTQFNGADEVCAVLGCEPADLDALCLGAFGTDFERASATFQAQGRAMLRRQQFALAMEGDRAMLQTLGRQHLGQDPFRDHARARAAQEADEDEGPEVDPLAEFAAARRPGGLPGA